MLFSLIANMIGGKKADLTLTKSSVAQPWISITDYGKKKKSDDDAVFSLFTLACN